MSAAFNQVKRGEYVAAGMSPRRVALVGNGSVPPNSGDVIDHCDVVVRFNKARGWQAEAGRRLDVLYLVNHGGQMKEWLNDGPLLAMRQVEAADTIALPVPMLEGHVTGTQATTANYDVDRINYGGEAAAQLEADGKKVRRHSPADYNRAVHRLRAHDTDAAPLYPSTGFLALSRMLELEPAGTEFYLWGYGFRGWSGHPWSSERAEVERLQKKGRVFVHGPV